MATCNLKKKKAFPFGDLLQALALPAFVLRRRICVSLKAVELDSRAE